MRRWFIAVAAVALLLCMFTSAGLWFWLGSEDGRQWLAGEVASLTHGSVEVHGLSGHPLSQLSADTVMVKSSGMKTELSAVTLEWSPWRLLAGDLSIAQFSVDKVGLYQQEIVSPQESGSFDLPPITLRINRLRIGEVTIEQGGISEDRARDIRIDSLRLTGSLSGELQATLPEGDLAAKLSGSPGRWLIDGRLHSEISRSLTAELTGKWLQSGMVKLIAEANANRGELEASWSRKNQELKADAKFHLSSASASADGIWSLLAPQSLERGHLNMHGVISADPLLNRKIELDVAADWSESGLLATAEERKHGLRLEVNYAAEQLHGLMTLVGWRSPLKNAAGQLSGKVDGSWQTGSGSWYLKGDIDEGRLAGLVASMQLDGKGDGVNWKLAKADIQALGLSLGLGGQGDADRFALSGNLEGTDISPALKFAGVADGGGSLRGKIGLQGSYGTPRLTVQAVAKRLQLELFTIETAELTATHASDEATYDLSASNLSFAGRQELDALKLEAQQKGSDVKLSWASQGKLQSRAQFAAQVSGEDKIDGVISDLWVSYGGTSVLEAKRLPFGLDGENMHLDKSALRLMGGKGSAAFRMTPEKVAGQLNVQAVKISGGEPWLKSLPFQFTGKADLSFALGGHPKAPTVVAALTSHELKLRHPMYAGEVGRSLQLSDAKLNLDYRKQQLFWQLHAKAPAEGVLAGDGSNALLFSIRPWQLIFPEGQAGKGALSVRLERLSDFQPLMPRIDPVEGRSDIDLKWSTPLDVSSVRGGGSITLDAIGIPEFGLEMKGALKASITKGRPAIDLLMKSGEGELRMKGAVDIDNRTMPDIHFKTFPLMQLPDQQLVVSGKISASEKQKISLISGGLEITHMRLEIPDPVPEPTEDLLWEEDQKTDETKKKAPLSKIDVDLNLSGDSEIYGRGMSLKPKGNLHLGGSLSQPRLTGVLEISSGKIEFRSVKLEILHGSRVIFSGDPKRPAIQIRAARKVGEVTAGVIVEGPADQLNTRLYSEPSMSNAEIFSYIATGRPLASLGTDGASDMMTAAEFILGPGTMMQEVQGKVMQVTGLDVFEIGGDSAGGQIRAGRKLSDEMTLTVEQVVAKEPSTAVTLEYMLTQSVSIFAKQAMNLAPRVGLRYSKEWFGTMKGEKK